jgi:ketosteroid isomerase-like protein
MSIEANKKLVTEFFAHFKRKEVQQVLDKMTPDATWWIGGKPDLFPICGTKTKAEIGELLMSLVPTTKDGLAITPSGMVAEGDKVAVEAESLGVLGNGRTYNNFYHFLITVRDGKISSVKEYLDTMHTADVLKG